MAERSGEKSGSRSFGFRNGVWMASVTASHSETREKSGVQRNFPARTTFRMRSGRPGSSPASGHSPLLSIAILYPDVGESRWNP